MAAASDGTLQAQTGYIQKMIQAANGRTLGLQVHLESGVRIVELDSKAVVIGQSPALALGSSDELLHWTVGKDGKKLALVTMDSAGQHNLHLIDVSALDSATMSNSSVLPINAMASSAEKVTDIAFFNSSNSIAVSIGNRVALVDVNQGSLVARSELSFSDAVMGIESDVRRGFLAVLQGKNIELRAIENPSQIVSSLQLNEEFTSLDMEENNLVVSNTTEYQMITF
jgi:hypothetical protein